MATNVDKYMNAQNAIFFPQQEEAVSQMPKKLSDYEAIQNLLAASAPTQEDLLSKVASLPKAVAPGVRSTTTAPETTANKAVEQASIAASKDTEADQGEKNTTSAEGRLPVDPASLAGLSESLKNTPFYQEAVANIEEANRLQEKPSWNSLFKQGAAYGDYLNSLQGLKTNAAGTIPDTQDNAALVKSLVDKADLDKEILSKIPSFYVNKYGTTSSLTDALKTKEALDLVQKASSEQAKSNKPLSASQGGAPVDLTKYWQRYLTDPQNKEDLSTWASLNSVQKQAANYDDVSKMPFATKVSILGSLADSSKMRPMSDSDFRKLLPRDVASLLDRYTDFVVGGGMDVSPADLKKYIDSIPTIKTALKEYQAEKIGSYVTGIPGVDTNKAKSYFIGNAFPSEYSKPSQASGVDKQKFKSDITKAILEGLKGK